MSKPDRSIAVLDVGLGSSRISWQPAGQEPEIEEFRIGSVLGAPFALRPAGSGKPAVARGMKRRLVSARLAPADHLQLPVHGEHPLKAPE